MRSFAQVKISIWADDDFRALPGDAQHLYFMLLTSADLDPAGVTDWRPARIAALVADWDAATVQKAADVLAERSYLVVDDDTEEVLIRSFMRHDGLLNKPNMATAAAKAYAGCASSEIRGALLRELHRLHVDAPDMRGWPQMADLLAVEPPPIGFTTGSVMGSTMGSVNPSDKGSPNPDPKGSPKGCLTPTPTPTPYIPSSPADSASDPLDLALTRIELQAIRRAIGSNCDAAWAIRVSRDVLSASKDPTGIRKPTEYVLRAITENPANYRPTWTPPPVQSCPDCGRIHDDDCPPSPPVPTKDEALELMKSRVAESRARRLRAERPIELPAVDVINPGLGEQSP